MFFPFKKKKLKIGLALGGGGMRGFAHVGVIKAFDEYGLKFDYICGTSVGSLVGAFYAAGWDYKQIYDIAKKIKTSDIKTNKIAFIPSKTDGIEQLIKENLGDINIEDLKIPYSAIAVDISTTEEVCLTKGNLAKAVAGSCSVPGVFQPVIYENRILCDGGLQNTMPSCIPRLMGCDYVIAVDVNKERSYGTNSTKFIDVIACSIRILMKSNVVKGYLNADVVLAPETKRFKSTRTDGMLDMIDEGYRAAVDKIQEIMEIFNGDAPKKKMVVEEENLVII